MDQAVSPVSTIPSRVAIVVEDVAVNIDQLVKIAEVMLESIVEKEDYHRAVSKLREMGKRAKEVLYTRKYTFNDRRGIVEFVTYGEEVKNLNPQKYVDLEGKKKTVLPRIRVHAGYISPMYTKCSCEYATKITSTAGKILSKHYTNVRPEALAKRSLCKHVLIGLAVYIYLGKTPPLEAFRNALIVWSLGNNFKVRREAVDELARVLRLYLRRK